MAVLRPQTDIMFRQERAFEKFETQTHFFHILNIDCILLILHPKASKNREKYRIRNFQYTQIFSLLQSKIIKKWSLAILFK